VAHISFLWSSRLRDHSSDAASAPPTDTLDNGLVLEQRIRLSMHSPWIEEEIVVRNPTLNQLWKQSRSVL
jgi:hypothetical protein